MKRRLALALILLGADIANAAAQAYPTKVVKIVVPSTAGSPTDAAARVLAQQLQSRLGQSVIVENRPGAGQTTGTKSVATAAPDGYTLLFAGDALGYFPVTYPNFNFDPLKSLTPVATAVTWSHVMVVASDIPAKTIAELVAYAKANPGRLIFGLRLGTVPHILAEAFRQATGADITFVPYTGGEQARAIYSAGASTLILRRSQISSADRGRPRTASRLHRIGTRGNAARCPNNDRKRPAAGRIQPGCLAGILGPAGMPAAVVDRLNSDVSASLQSAEMKAVLARLGFEPKAMTPREFEDFLAAEIRKWPPLLRAAGLKPE